MQESPLQDQDQERSLLRTEFHGVAGGFGRPWDVAGRELKHTFGLGEMQRAPVHSGLRHPSLVDSLGPCFCRAAVFCCRARQRRWEGREADTGSALTGLDTVTPIKPGLGEQGS